MSSGPHTNPSRDEAQVRPPPARPWLHRLLPAGIVLLALTHLPFVGKGYGEGDAAWTAIVATLWAQDGYLPLQAGPFVQRRLRSNPLYIYLIKQLLVEGIISRDQVSGLMNGLSALCGIFVPAAVFFLLRGLTSSAEAAIALILLMFAPIFFQSKCDGFPTLSALWLLVLALLAFQKALRLQPLWYAWAVLAGCLLVLAVLTKVDVVLLASGFPVIALVAPAVRQRKKIIALACVLPVLSVLIWHLFCQQLAPRADDTFLTFRRWSQTYPLTPAGLLDAKNLKNLVMAPGVGTAIAFLPVLALCLVRKDWRTTALAVLACIAPTLIFWGMRELNSSRHNLWIVIPMTTIIAFVIQRAVRRTASKIVLVVAICSANYFVGPTQLTSMTASARLLASANERKLGIANTHRVYRLALSQHIPGGKICFYRDRGIAWIASTAVFLADYCTIHQKGPNVWNLRARIDGQTKTIWVPDPDDISLATLKKIHDEGWTAINRRPTEPPFLLILPDGKLAPWPSSPQSILSP